MQTSAHPGWSMLMAVLAFALYSTMDMMVKLLTGHLRVTQILFSAGVVGLLPILVMVRRRGGWSQLRTQRLRWHLARGSIGVLGAACSFYAYSRLPLADAYAIAFSAPLFITMLSVPLLGEHVGWRRWSAVGIGFLGVVIMLRPGAGIFGLGSVAALGGAVGHAGSVLLVRHLRRTETLAAQMFYPTCVTIVATGLTLPWAWTPPSPGEWLLLLAIGACSGVAGICLVTAYRGASATIVAPFQYTQMLWGMAYGFLLWRQTPDTQMLLGAMIVVCTGLYILHRETVRHTEIGSSAKGSLGVGAPIVPPPETPANANDHK